jgi:hypothetical protein
VIDESKPFLPHSAEAPLLGDASFAHEEEHDAGDDAASEAPAVTAAPSRVGGSWVSCYGGFAPGAEPLADVTRLGLLCGPINGMRRVGGMQGTIRAGPRPPKPQHDFKVATGACYRVFAVAADPVVDLDVTVLSSRGSRLVSDNSEDRWPIVEPERPFCSFEDDVFGITLESKSGSGNYALEVWMLPSSAKP